jgi:hypothetical protein
VRIVEREVVVVELSSEDSEQDPVMAMRNKLRVKKRPFVVHQLKAKLEHRGRPG